MLPMVPDREASNGATRPPHIRRPLVGHQAVCLQSLHRHGPMSQSQHTRLRPSGSSHIENTRSVRDTRRGEKTVHTPQMCKENKEKQLRLHAYAYPPTLPLILSNGTPSCRLPGCEGRVTVPYVTSASHVILLS